MQARLLTALIAIQQQIQVQRARAPTLAVAGTAVLSFDREQCVEQGARGQGRLQIGCGVAEIGLLGVAPGRRQEIRGASCRERVCRIVEMSVVGDSLKKKSNQK